MQQRQYGVPVGLSVALTVAGVVVMVLGTIVVPAATSQLQQGGMAGVVIGSIAIPVGVLFFALGRRPETLTVDDAGLHLRTLTRTRVIPWSIVQSFRAQPGGRGWWFVRAELGTGKKVLLPGPQGTRNRTERIAAELTAAHAEYLASGDD